MREIAWLQVSDIHMRQRDEWSQDVVLRAMTDSIRQRRRDQGLTLDFILATGDLAFSGKQDEYELVKHFFDELVSATGVPKERIFCIPGNHDVDRDRQKLCFQGARSALTSVNAVDPVLAPDSDDLATLTQRQEGYRAFQTSYFGGQARTVTPDGLAYVSSLAIDNVVIAIVGLNSAWLAEGGNADHGNLLIGERQVINAFDAAVKLHAHIVIGMAHHPLHLLRDFDRTAATRRITERCYFYHCGHLHQPESQGSGFDASACLTVAAGASFETREFQNAYSLVKLDLLAGIRKLTTVQYNPARSVFEFSNEVPFPIRLSTAARCTVGELAEAIGEFDAMLLSHSYYLAALLTEHKTEVPIPGQGGHAFGAPSVLQDMLEDNYCRKVVAFLRFANVLTVFYGRRPLADLLAQHGQIVRAYGADLLARCQSDAALASRLAQQDTDVRSLFAAQPKVSFAVDLFADLVRSQELELLAEQARRHLENPDVPTQVQARRMLAFALAHSTEDSDRNEAIRAYEALIHDGLADAQDRGNLATLLLDIGRSDEAKAVVLEAIAASSREALELFNGVGQRIVGQTGDRDFRTQLRATIGERGGRD
ncbi:MAG TPA: metallophosphoesterase [Candidatus Competibacteraceae bacterium]|nr:metallophosphoesterase [Candidatus Competibacteraceae bacterium]MCB1782223.1 metallophosphoesterase [Candidatus Competibacteraceae bacterium]MCP5134819.1 metallophosphoesterase [Gammaproteobacteria bacterium]HRY18752.1 metallophosphoesterase [Candidatus Competibacteraceae bacterium]